ncbi:MAG TPA: peptidyl-prolyl cis-trans isomerase [Micavibrio sp.]|nr:peptidyl-prolyl cis-trans isomerase [Micavibrio sp.]
MLIWMRNSTFGGFFKYFLLGMMTMAVGGLVMMDFNDFFQGTMSQNTVVKGGGVKIGTVEFDRTVRRVLSQQGIPAPEAYKLGLINNILTSEVQNRLFTKESRSLGLQVSDDSVMAEINRLAEPLAANGRSKKDALQQILRQQGISEPEFIGSIRQEMANGLLRGALSAPPTLTSPLMAESLYRFDNEKRAADIIVVKTADAKGADAPTDEQLEKLYEANKMDFLIPETRTVTMATLKSDMIRKNIKITDEQLKAEYEKNIAAFTKPSKRVVDQIVLSTEDEAKKAAEEMKSGATPKNAVSQEYEESGLLPEIGAPVFAAEKGAVIGPVKTSLGFHVLKVKDILPEKVTPLDDMKDSLRTELENMALTEELYNTGNTIEDRAAAGDKLEDIVNEYGMTTEIIGPFRQNGTDRDGRDVFKSYGADKDKIIQTAYDYEEGEIAPVVETADGQFHLIRIDQAIPDTYRPFDSVKSELQARWLNEQKNLLAQAEAKKLLDALNSGKSIDEVARENNLSVQSVSGIGRKGETPAPLTPVVGAQVLNTAVGKNFSSAIDGGYVVGTVTNITMPEAKPDAKNLAELEDLTGRSLAQDILGQFVTALTDGKEIKVNQAALDQIYGDQQQNQPQ